ncbi:hypothetical protein IV203_009558 [Nitzschia inconspicua]|uniref:Uncharacterized protein n=1 Tax=Nitzschia inconspicua TaxID=303405 RepID=A0A9K3KUI1_9STRA|nr:hypothetical protein IV203_009558 [Nitzschia inconspicua]
MTTTTTTTTTTTKPNDDLEIVVLRLAEDLEGLTIVDRSDKSSTSMNQSSNHVDVSLLVPSLYQFYTVGILLFHHTNSNNQINNTNQINNNNHFVTSYQELIESIPETLLRNTFGQLQTATNKLLTTVTTKPNNRNRNDTAGIIENDLLPTCRSLCGLFAHSSRLCRVVYNCNNNNNNNDWITTLGIIIRSIDRTLIIIGINIIIIIINNNNNNNNIFDLCQELCIGNVVVFTFGWTLFQQQQQQQQQRYY